MDKQEDEKDNLTRVGLAVLDEIQDAVRSVIDSNIPSSLEDIFNNYQHRFYHHFSKKCHSKCDINSPLFRNRIILTKSQMEIVYEKSKIHSEKNLSFCCSTAIPGIESKKFDLSFLNAFLTIFSEIIYWPSCLSNQSKSLQDLLDDNKHKLYHFYDKKPCCYCSPGNQPSTDDFKITEQEFENLFGKQGSVSCKNTGSIGDCICQFSANNLREDSLGDWLTYMVLRSCCSLKQCIESLVKVRNKFLGHSRNSKMSKDEYKKTWKIIQEKVPELLNHGIFDKKKREEAVQEFTQRLKDLKVKPLTEELYRQVMTNLLQQNEIIQDMKELSENVEAGFQNFQSVAENTQVGVLNLQSVAKNTQAGVLNLQSVTENTQTRVLNLQSVAENTQAGVSNLQSLPDRVDGIEKTLIELNILVRDRNIKSDLDTDTAPFSTIDEPGSQDQNTNSDLDADAEPYLIESEPRSQGAEAADRRDERSVELKEQSNNITGATGSEKTFRQDGYAYDILVLHSEHDEEHVDVMMKMIKEKVALPDIKIASVGEDIPPGANVFEAFHDLMDASCSLLLFITPHFYTDCLSKFRLQTQLAHKMEDEPCVIPVLFGEEKIRKDLRDIGHIQSLIFFKEKDGDKYKSFIRKITRAIQQYRTKGNK
ncbi:uncharacterized protein LOC127715077 [Mytilus californianus]|uniref:uncharacterized protein LOC127715077 n=1 Tax=Mytilus californianus TaxID=6549 RepID=UPI00224800EC|nr:uncharacterized protein LOC127715077 [Mytilus californianus]XP_052077067.1 uncharacterized protein LOC127715077 [Mytilus californianus]